jgi:hypothetical protein
MHEVCLKARRWNADAHYVILSKQRQWLEMSIAIVNTTAGKPDVVVPLAAGAGQKIAPQGRLR